MFLIDAQSTVNFLSAVQLDSEFALEVVLRAWLANFEVFKGFDEIRLKYV